MVSIVEVEGEPAIRLAWSTKRILLMLSGHLVHNFVVNRYRCK